MLVASGSLACRWMCIIFTKACISDHVLMLVSVISLTLDSIFEPMMTLSCTNFMVRGNFSRAFSILDFTAALVSIVVGSSGLLGGEDADASDMFER